MKNAVILDKKRLLFGFYVYEAATFTGTRTPLLKVPTYIPVFGIIPKTGI